MDGMKAGGLIPTLGGWLAVVFWALSSSLNRRSGEVLGPWATLAITQGLGLLLLGTVAWVRAGFRFSRPRVTSKSLLLASLYTVYLGSIYFAISHAADRDQAVAVILLNLLWPSLILLGSVVVFGNRLRAWFPLGMVLAFAGAAVALLPRGHSLDLALLTSRSSGDALPLVVAFLSGFLWAAYSNLNRLWSSSTSNQMLVNLPLGFLVFSLLGAPRLASLAHGTPFPPSALILAVINNLAFVLWEVALRRGNATWVVVSAYFSPIVATLLASVVLGIALGPALAWACLLVSAGAFVCGVSIRERAA